MKVQHLFHFKTRTLKIVIGCKIYLKTENTSPYIVADTLMNLIIFILVAVSFFGEFSTTASKEDIIYKKGYANSHAGLAEKTYYAKGY